MWATTDLRYRRLDSSTTTVQEMVCRAFKKLWVRILLRSVRFSDRHGLLDQLYRFEDPWNQGSELEHFRFKETNRFILAQAGSPRSILEIGCGEGHQSRELMTISERLIGIDVSARAVKRARKRVTSATFLTGDFTTVAWPTGSIPVDVVAACEVLYYMSDIPNALTSMAKLGRKIVVTYVDSRRANLDPIIKAIPGVVMHRFGVQNVWWTAAYWEPPNVAD